MTGKECGPDSIVVTPQEGGHRLCATRPIGQGERILVLAGVLLDHPTRHSVQVDTDRHLDTPPGTAPEVLASSFPFRYLNHSCRPNARIGEHSLWAVADIATGEEITFNYNTTELELSHPFTCRCGHCAGVPVRGWSHLSAGEQERLRPLAAPHLIAAPGGVKA